MVRWLIIMALALGGLALIANGIYIERQIRAALEDSTFSGVNRTIVSLFSSKRRTLEEYQFRARLCLIVGPGLLITAYLVWASRARPPAAEPGTTDDDRQPTDRGGKPAKPRKKKSAKQ